MSVETADLTSLTCRTERYFALPWRVCEGGVVRFVDEGNLGRQMRLFLAIMVWTMSAGLVLLIPVMVFWTGWSPVVIILGLGAVVLLLAGVPIAGRRRWRIVEVHPDGAVSIQSSRDRDGHERPPRSAGALEVCKVSANVHRTKWRGFAVVAGDGSRRVILCLCPTLDACYDVVSQWPDAIQRLPVATGSTLILTISWA